MCHQHGAVGLFFLSALLQARRVVNPIAPNASTTLVYDVPVSLTIPNGTLLPDTSIAYGEECEKLMQARFGPGFYKEIT
jgi:hypothetical protein